MVMVLAACGSGDSDLGAEAPNDGSSAAPGAPAGEPEADGPVVHGSVVTTDGRPVVNAEISIVGNLDHNGEYVAYTPRTGPDGRYQATVLPGEFSVSGLHTTDYLGKRYTFGLAPESGGNEETFRIQDAPVERSFVWKISGRRPGSEGAGEGGDAFFGGEAQFTIADVKAFRMHETHFADEFGSGFEAKVELVPEGPLADGSTGMTYASSHSVTMPNEAEWTDVDIPVGKYLVKVTVVRADGSTKPVEVLGVDVFPTGPGERQPAPVYLTFEPNPSAPGGLQRMRVILAYGPPYDPVEL
jgi:hypothetical protein